MSLTSAARVQVSTRQEYDGENSVHEMEQLPRMQSEGETGEAEQTLHSREAGDDEKAGAKTPAEWPVSEVLKRAPNAKDNRRDEQDPRSIAVKEGEGAGQE